MSMQTKTIGRMPTDHGPYDPQLAYGKKFQCTLFGCAWESLHDNNNTAPAVWDGGDVITPNLVDWKKVSGSYEAWLMNKDKPATSEQYPYNGMGRVVLKKHIVDGVNTLTHEAFEDSEGNDRENTIYVIQYDFDLDGAEITIPANCVLEFEGGSLSNGTLTGNGTQIIAPKVAIFTGITIVGTWNVPEISSTWFSDATSVTDKILELFNLCDENVSNLVVIENGTYNVAAKSSGYQPIISPVSNTDICIKGKIKQSNDGQSSYNLFYLYNVHNIRFYGFGTLEGNSRGQEVGGTQSGIGIRIKNSYNIEIKDLSFYYLNGDGIFIDEELISEHPELNRSHHIVVDGVTIEGGKQNGVAIVSGYNIIVRNCTIKNLLYSRLGPLSAIDIETSGDTNGVSNVLVENIIADNMRNGLSIIGTYPIEDVTIRNYKATNCFVRGVILTYNLRNITIENSYFETVGKEVLPQTSEYYQNTSYCLYYQATKTSDYYINGYTKNIVLNNVTFTMNKENATNRIHAAYILHDNIYINRCQFLCPYDSSVGASEQSDVSFQNAENVNFDSCIFDISRFTEGGTNKNISFNKCNFKFYTLTVPNAMFIGNSFTSLLASTTSAIKQPIKTKNCKGFIDNNVKGAIQFIEPSCKITGNTFNPNTNIRIADNNTYCLVYADTPSKCIIEDNIFNDNNDGYNMYQVLYLLNSEFVSIKNNVFCLDNTYNGVASGVPKNIVTLLDNRYYHTNGVTHGSFIRSYGFHVRTVDSSNTVNMDEARVVETDMAHLGYPSFETTLKIPLWWNNEYWIDAAGNRMTYPVSYTLTNLTASNDRQAKVGSTYSTKLIADSSYSLPATITVKMGSSTLSAGTDYTYNSADGQIQVLGVGGTGGVTGDLVISAAGV